MNKAARFINSIFKKKKAPSFCDILAAHYEKEYGSDPHRLDDRFKELVQAINRKSLDYGDMPKH